MYIQAFITTSIHPKNGIIGLKVYKLTWFFDESWISYHKKRILKNSKKVYAATCPPIALKDNWSFGSNPSYKVSQNPRFSEVSEKWFF